MYICLPFGWRKYPYLHILPAGCLSFISRCRETCSSCWKRQRPRKGIIEPLSTSLRGLDPSAQGHRHPVSKTKSKLTHAPKYMWTIASLRICQWRVGQQNVIRKIPIKQGVGGSVRWKCQRSSLAGRLLAKCEILGRKIACYSKEWLQYVA